MKLQRRPAVAVAALLPACAYAHSPIKGILPFYAGALHPFVVPAHIIAVIALGLLIGQHPSVMLGRAVLGLFIGLVLGLSAGGMAGDPDTDIPLLAISALVAVAVAWKRPLAGAALVGVAGLLGVLIGLGSGPDGLAGTPRVLFLVGACVGAVLGVTWIAALREILRRPWQQVAARVVGSWIAASAILVLALTWAGPRKPAARDPAGQPPAPATAGRLPAR